MQQHEVIGKGMVVRRALSIRWDADRKPALEGNIWKGTQSNEEAFQAKEAVSMEALKNSSVDGMSDQESEQKERKSELIETTDHVGPCKTLARPWSFSLSEIK